VCDLACHRSRLSAIPQVAHRGAKPLECKWEFQLRGRRASAV
jgi:hypothetical protein